MSTRWPKIVSLWLKMPPLQKVKLAGSHEILVQGTMFDSPYRGGQSRYSRHFTVVDSPPTCLQGDQKWSIYGWKCPHHRRSKLQDRSKLWCGGPCLTLHISAVNRDIPDILHHSIVRQHVCKRTKTRRSTAENAFTTEGQTCGIAPKLHFLGAIISEPWSQNFKILQQSTELFACVRCVKNNKNCFVGS